MIGGIPRCDQLDPQFAQLPQEIGRAAPWFWGGLYVIERMKRPEDFRRVYRNGHMKFGKFTAVHVLEVPEEESFRVGFSVSKKVGNAVVRNGIKRRLREILRSLDSELPSGYHMVIGTKVRARDADYWDLEKDICQVMKGLGFLRKNKRR